MTITALFWNPDLRHNGAAGFAHNKEKSHMARRNRRRSFGLSPRRNRGRRASRRNAWSEAKTMIVKKAPRHSEVAAKAWTPARKKAARKSRKYKGTYGKAAPAKRSKRKAAAAPAAAPRKRAKARKGSRKPKAHAAKRTSSRKKAVKKNGRRRVTRNRRSHRRTHRNSRRRMHRNGRRSHRRNSRRRSRRNGYAGLLMTVAGIGVGLAAASYLSSQLVDYLSKPGADGKSKIPASLVEYAPAILAAGATAAVWYGLKKFGGAKAAPHLKTVVGGGIAASLFLLAMHVKMKNAAGVEESIAQKVGLLPKSTVVVDTKVGGYGVFGLGSNYGVFGLNGYTDVGGMVSTPGGPLAVEGVISIPGGGPLAVEGASFGGYLGGTLTDSVLGTPKVTSGPAPNPFAPGLREGNRGTMNEAHAGEVADAGSLSGNIFS